MLSYAWLKTRYINSNLKETDMAVERVDYYSQEDYEQACEFEAQSWPESPEVDQCSECGGSMYVERPGDHLCPKCKSVVHKTNSNIALKETEA
jgi:hypothetical protein